MELNAEKIKKALECCVTDSCFSCPYDDVGVYSQCVPTLLENALSLINSQEQRIKEITEEYDSIAKSVNEASDVIRKLRFEKKEITEENERYKAKENEQFEKWLKLEKATREHHSELFKEAKIAVKEDTVRKMQERLKERFSTATRYTKYSGAGVVMVIDQIAKEMVEDKPCT